MTEVIVKLNFRKSYDHKKSFIISESVRMLTGHPVCITFYKFNFFNLEFTYKSCKGTSKYFKVFLHFFFLFLNLSHSFKVSISDTFL
jgi:hypothetical protein